jgi:hypothetical protein
MPFNSSGRRNFKPNFLFNDLDPQHFFPLILPEGVGHPRGYVPTRLGQHLGSSQTFYRNKVE